ncbi:MAG: glycogen/starch synthase [Polaribacter sp.]
MPRYGVINERRHQLHEVIRLSGMNLVINDMDMPLIIKVASIPKERMQVYFIDNEEYFKRKAVYTDEDDTLFSDNDERAIFFAKGVIETVKKLNWAPDIIHIHGWLASLIPLYLREYYNEEPLFTESKIVTSIYEKGFEGTINKNLAEKINFDFKNKEKIATVKTPNHTNILKSAIENSDAIIYGSENFSEEISSFIESKDIPVLEYQSENFKENYLNFYADLISAN